MFLCLTCRLADCSSEQRAGGRAITAARPGLPATTLCLGIKLWSVSHVKQSSKRAGGGSGCLNPETTLSWCLFFPLGPPRQRGGPCPGNQPPSSRVCPPQWDVLCLTPPPRNPSRPRLRGDSAPCEQCLLRDEIQGQWVEAGEGWESRKGGATPFPPAWTVSFTCTCSAAWIRFRPAPPPSRPRSLAEWGPHTSLLSSSVPRC